MLILTRRPGESICIGATILVRVLSVSGKVVRLGITAPRSVEIARGERLSQAAPQALAEANETDCLS